MNVKSQRIARKVRILTDPKPNFVSIVSNGANQTPFSVVKRAQPPKGKVSKVGAIPMPLRPVNLNKVLKKDNQQPSASTAVFKVEFDADEFTEETATKWLEDNKWDNYEVKFNEDDNVYVAKSTSVSRGDLASVKEVLVEKGIAAYAGPLKAETTQKGKGSDSTNGQNGSIVNQPEKDKGKGKNGNTSAKAQKSGGDDEQQGDDEGDGEQQESVIKLDWWEMYQSRGESVAEVLKDGMADGMPPGMDSIMSATMYAIKNVLTGSGDTAEKTEKLGSVGAEMASIMGTVYDLYEGANGLTRKQQTEDTQAFVDAYEAQLEAIVEPDEELSVAEEVQKAAGGENEDDDKSKDKGKNKPKDKTKKSDEDGLAVDGTLSLDRLSNAFANAMSKSPVVKAVSRLERVIAEQGKALKTAKDRADEAVRKAEELGNRAPVKKGHDNDPDEDEQQDKAGTDFVSDNLSSFFGLSRKKAQPNRHQ